jgi:hypothetical protein
MIVHMADNIASKVHYIVDGNNVIKERWDLSSLNES